MTHEPAARTARSDTSAQKVGGLVILPCSAEVQTRDGLIPAEYLMPGDDLIARERGYIRLRHVSRLRQPTRAVWVWDGFLPGLAPEGGVFLPTQQPVLRRDVRENTPLPAQALASLGLAEEIGMRQLTMLQLWLPVVDTVYAAGLELVAIPVVQRQRKAA